MAKNKNTKRFGLFYRSNGRWTTTPYQGMTFTSYQVNRNPIKDEISFTKNYILKSRVRVLPVKA
jgi:hypothetical protein